MVKVATKTGSLHGELIHRPQKKMNFLEWSKIHTSESGYKDDVHTIESTDFPNP